MAEEEDLDEGRGRTRQDSEKMKQRSLRDRGRQWFLTLGTGLALLATIIGFLSDSVGVLEFLQGSAPELVPTEVFAARLAVDEERHVTPRPTDEPTETSAPTATATPMAAATPTPLPVVATAGERLLIVAQFANFATDANYNVAGRIHEALSEQVSAARLTDTRVEVWPDIIDDESRARQIVEVSGAALMIWGEYDSGRVRVRFTLVGGAESDWQRLLGTPTELSTTINLDVPRETQALALIALGRLYRNAGEMNQARAAFAQALAQQPSDEQTVATLTFYLAILDAAANPPALEQAIAGYTTVIELRPEWHNARYNRGLAYLNYFWLTGDATHVDNAIVDFTATLEIRRSYVEAYINRAIAYYARNGEGDLEASVNDLSAAIGFNPLAYRAYYNRGLAYIRLDHHSEWVDDFNQALEIAPEFWVTHHALCWGYALDQMPESALPHCEEATRKDPSGSTLDGRGLVMAQMDRIDEAIADLEQYLTWLDTQPEVWSEISNRPLYEEVLAGLRVGENRVTPELLEKLR